ncbi:MAG: purine-nucleoside phosphorylase [Lentisphaerae bacterium]|nr:purine-nucleoside phosphorylase [Lentisphaerota bacterium]
MNMALMEESLAAVCARLPACRPHCALIAGSGWAPALDALATRARTRYADIPHLGALAVPGHPGELRLATHAGCEALVFAGRRHWYEGGGWEPVALPVYLALKLGASVLVLTNAAGGIREDLAPGDLMTITDHINAMGVNPLVGNRDPLWGPLFADQTCVYDAPLRLCLDAAAARSGVALTRGVYAAVSGPVYETPAEIRALRAAGADAVGMSTVPEALLGSAAGMRVLGIACVSNRAARSNAPRLNHADAVAVTTAAAPRMRALLCALLEDIPKYAALPRESA